MKLFFTCIISLIYSITACLHSQNLVLNPSFENTSACPGGISEFYKCTSWDQLNNSGSNCPTPDLYATCSSVIGGANSPNALLGYQQSRTGSHHAGIILFETTPLLNDTTCNNAILDSYREYIEGQLSSPMTAGQDYCVTFFVNLAGGVKWGSDEIGVYFSNTQVTQDCSNPILTVTPQLQYNGPALLDTITWVKLQWTYTATGGEQYFVIGNFTPNSSVTIANNYCATWQHTYAYYFIDDVSITPGACVPCPNISIQVTSQTNVLCAGNSTGSVSISALGGSSPYTYNWSPIVNDSASLSSLPAGTYYVNASDSNLCIGNDTVVITEPAVLNVSIAVISGCDSTPGSAAANVSGGVSPYSYQWSNGATSDSIGSLPVGTYTLTVTDSNNCTSILSTTITQASILNLTTSSTQASCGINNGTATVNATGGTSPYSYLWSNGDTAQTATGLSAGTYSVTVNEFGTGSGIFWSEDFSGSGAGWTLNQNGTGPNGSTANQWIINNDNGCGPCGSGGNYLHVTCGGGFVCPGPGECFYDLSAASFFGDPTTDKFVSSPDISTVGKTNIVLKFRYQSGGEAGADYGSVRLSNNGGATWTDLPAQYAGVSICTQETINVPASCEGITNFRVAFRWINNASNTGSGDPFAIDDVELSATANSSCPNTISVTVGSSSGISSSVMVNNTSCSVNNGSAIVNVSGGSTPYSYAWSNGDSSSTATGLGGGNYFVTITDASGCSLVDTAVVNVTGGPATAVSSNDVSCNGGNNGSATATASGGSSPYTYAWSNGATSATASGLIAGNYTVTVTDNNNCNDTATVFIAQPQAIVSAFTVVDASCGMADGSVTVSVTGGISPYSYLWINGQTAATASSLAAGSYSVTITDAGNCTNIASATVSNAGAPTATTSSSDPGCNNGSDGSATVSASGGATPYTFTWSNGQTSSSISGLSPGIYTVTVTDAGNCQAVVSDTVNNPSPVQILFAGGDDTDTICSGNSSAITAFGGTSYLWSTGATTSSISVSPAANASYFVTATDDSGCTGSDTFNVTVVSASINAACSGSGITLSASNGSAYLWSSGATTQSITVSPSVLTDYMVTITASCGQLVDTISVSPPVNVIVSNDTIIEYGTAIQLSASGGANYLWNTGETSQNITVAPLENTAYIVTITDASGCSDTASINITVDNSSHAISVPTIFSPNKDGINDFIKVHGYGVKEYKLVVYDRWGEIVFEDSGTSLTNGGVPWDGSFKGNQLNSAVFVYILSAVFVDNTEFREKGNITLLR